MAAGVVAVAGAIVILWLCAVGIRRQKLWSLWLLYTQEFHGATHGGIVEACPKAICCNFVRRLEKIVGPKAIDMVRRAAPKSRRKFAMESRDDFRAGRITISLDCEPAPGTVIKPIPVRIPDVASGPHPRRDLQTDRISDPEYYEANRAYFLGFCQRVAQAEAKHQASRAQA